MVVTTATHSSVLERLNSSAQLSLDCEATGLRVHHNDVLFSVIVSDDIDTYYFNFHSYPLEGVDGLDRSLIKEFARLRPKRWFLANAKFDMHMLAKEGVQLSGEIWDVLVIAKCLNNSHMAYGLDSVASRLGYEKLNTVDKYIDANKLYTVERLPGKKTRTKNKHFDLVPFHIMHEYAERDARITYDIGIKQMEKVAEIDEQSKLLGYPSFNDVITREMKTTEVCYEIERVGMAVNEEYIRRALAHEQSRALAASKSFEEISGKTFVDSNKALGEAFGSFGIDGGRTDKGNLSFTDDVLEEIKHPIAELVRTYRDATKRANTYYTSFLSHADTNGVVHPSIRQTGADTFRFSITDPALQTLNSKETGEFKVRNSFMAPKGLYYVAIDYKQQEYRLAADYAGEMALIAQIRNGTDVHTATAALMGVERDPAKTLNFMLLYGGGVAKLCIALFNPTLGEMALKAITWKRIYKSMPKDKEDAARIEAAYTPLTLEQIEANLPLLMQAYALQQKYFSSLTKTKALIDKVSARAKEKGVIYNWAGRKLHFNNKKFCYKAPNHLIQSSGAEIMRGALIELHEFLKPYRTRIVLSIHDEILLQMPEEEFDLIPEIREIMVKVYKPFNGLMMDTSVSYGLTWGDMEKGVPDGAKVRDLISRKSARGPAECAAV